jgi:hypothetical protein
VIGRLIVAEGYRSRFGIASMSAMIQDLRLDRACFAGVVRIAKQNPMTHGWSPAIIHFFLHRVYIKETLRHPIMINVRSGHRQFLGWPFGRTSAWRNNLRYSCLIDVDVDHA